MAENWAAIAADVLAAIADVGFSVSISRKTVQGEVPWSPTATVAAPVTCKAIDKRPTFARMAGESEVATGRALLVAPGANVPALGDRVTVRGTVHEVLRVDAVAPGGVDLLYVVELAA